MTPLVELIVSQPGLAQRLLAHHADDGKGRCRLCTLGAQTGHHRFPCTIHVAATHASEVERLGGSARPI